MADQTSTKDTGQDADTPDTEETPDEADRSAGAGGSTPPGQSRKSKGIGDLLELTADAQVNFNIHGDVHAGSVGVQGRSRPPARRKATGRLNHRDIEDALRQYLPPDGYNDALDGLHHDSVVVLCGPAGCGRRAGAISLLRDVTDATLVVLSPLITLDELADRDYDRGFGYLVLEHRAAGTAADSDFAWRTVQNKVSDAGAYLVVTAAGSPDGTPEAVRHIGWAPPPALDLLRAHLTGIPYDDAQLAEVAEALPEDCTVAKLVALARRIVEGEEPGTALAELEQDSRQEVRTWFRDRYNWSPLDRQEVLEVTALAFSEGTTERVYEARLEALKERLSDWLPVNQKSDEAKAAANEIALQGRVRRARGDGITVTRTSAVDGIPRTTVHFKSAGYRQQVVAELLGFESRFWNGVHQWLYDVVAEQPDVPAAWGLAAVAEVSLEEVIMLLAPWSAGKLGWTGQATATFVLWVMCLDETLAPLALRAAVNWATQGSPAQRWTAANALSGTVGLCYPTEAVRRLWQLVAQSAQPGDACAALANLFAHFCADAGEADDRSGDASLILTVLERQLDRYRERGAGSRPMVLTMTAILAVLSVLHPQNRQPSSFVLLHARPDLAPVLGRLWAGVLTHRVFRKSALLALRKGLRALRRISDDPRVDARALGEALATALPGSEHAALRRDFDQLDPDTKQPDPDSLIQVLLTALERFHPRFDQKDS